MITITIKETSRNEESTSVILATCIKLLLNKESIKFCNFIRRVAREFPRTRQIDFPGN